MGRDMGQHEDWLSSGSLASAVGGPDGNLELCNNRKLVVEAIEMTRLGLGFVGRRREKSRGVT